MVMMDTREQDWNAESPILVTPVGMVRVCKAVQPVNASDPTLVHSIGIVTWPSTSGSIAHGGVGTELGRDVGEEVGEEGGDVGGDVGEVVGLGTVGAHVAEHSHSVAPAT